MAGSLTRSIGISTVALAIAGFAIVGEREVARAEPDISRPHHQLTAKESLGKALFFDTSLSSPAGQSCGSCHSPATGFTFPDSAFNEKFGTAPGVIRGRFVSRAVPQVSYSAFNPPGPYYDKVLELYAGGQFWDGRVSDLAAQAKLPFVSPNEMNNLTHNMPDPSLVVRKVSRGRFAGLFKHVYGDDIFSQPTNVVYDSVADAITAYEKSTEVSPFSSKYDAWRAGKVDLTPQELHGLRIATGSWTGRPDGAPFPRFIQCVACHSVPEIPSGGPDLWTNTCYQNIGVPRNPSNPFYTMTNPATNPVGYNPLGAAFVDLGFGGALYPQLGLPPGNMGPGSDGRGDFYGINGIFKAPSLRNVDLRPYPGFVKAYMHNGALKSLKEVVHFYNTRNLTTVPGEVVDFTKTNPYEGLVGKPLWGTPEFPSPDTLHNPAGDSVNDPGTMLAGLGGESSAQVGHLEMTDEEEDDVVAFLKTLSDGYFEPLREGDVCNAITSQPVSQNLCVNGSAKITVVSLGPGPWTYQWRRGSPPAPIPGATQSYYQIILGSASDVDAYDCVVTNGYGMVISRPARLTVCMADFNCDGDITIKDLFDFLSEWFAGDPLADINRSGATNVQDLFDFLAAWFGKCA